jgi:hypothetical protein
VTVDVTATALAVPTNVEVKARRAVPTDAPDLPGTGVTGNGKRVAARMMKVVEEHDGGMLGATECVELIVPELAHLEERVAAIKERARDDNSSIRVADWLERLRFIVAVRSLSLFRLEIEDEKGLAHFVHRTCKL